MTEALQESSTAKIGKVFCIGFQKTGTSSMRDALESLGYSVTGVFGHDQSLEDLRATYVERGIELAKGFDAVEDMPWPLMYRELDAAFPGSKFILTVRSTDKWYQSIARHFGSNPYHIQQLTYGDDAPAPVGHEERYKQVYEAHNQAVQDYFAGREADLLVMSLEHGDGWEKLGAFLGRSDIPSGPFVHTNSASQRNSLLQRIFKRLRKAGLPIKELAR